MVHPETKFKNFSAHALSVAKNKNITDLFERIAQKNVDDWNHCGERQKDVEPLDYCAMGQEKLTTGIPARKLRYHITDWDLESK